MVYRDYWALSQWYAHYSRHLGSEHLFIVAHGSDPKIAALCPRANVLAVPRSDLAGFDRMRGQMLNSIQDGLGVIYDWVIRTDADELICLDPAHHASFATLFRSHRRSNALFALGLNIAEDIEDGTMKATDAALTKRSNAVFSGHYSKAWAVRRGTHLVRHGINLAKDAAMVMPEGVYLAHLKYASIDALTEANLHRSEIASGKEDGLPGKAWLHADKDAQKFFDTFHAAPVVDWNAAKADAYAKIAHDPVAEASQKVLRARSVTFDSRTVLPDWFKYC
nr:glycosyltransferase family 2 protein [Sulfitobacter alexandrii]